MKMPLVKYNKGELVMGRWPGSSLYYEVKVLDYDVTAQLYTVIYKDGTELELREQDIKSVAGFQTRSHSRSRSPSRRRSRSRSPARTTRRSSSSPARTTRRSSSSPARTTRRSSSRTAAAMAAAAITESIPSSHRDAKLKDTLEVRLSPLETMENNKYQIPEDNKAPATGTESKEEVEAEKRQSRYNLRRRKEEADGRSAEDKTAQELRQVQEKDASFSAVAAASPAPQLDFGGKIGAYFWLLFLPAWVLFLILQVNLADPSLANFPPTLPALGTLWDGQALAFVVLWILFQALLYLLPLGKLSDGMPLKSGQRLKYRTNGFLALVLSCAGTAAAAYQGVDFTYIHSHFLQLAVASFMVSTLLSIYLYVRSLSAAPADLALGGSSGNVVYDFFKGRELNPRLKGFDLKFFCEMRPGLIGWCLINFAMALAEMKQQQVDTPSASMILVNLFQLLYVLDGLWNEEAILTTMDLMHDGFGFMLAFGDLVWVPFTYTLQAYYLVSHPSPLSPPALAAIVTLKAIGFYIFRKSNSEKNAFRRNPADPNLAHLKTIPTATGKSLLVSGWWGVVRHPNYVGDLLMALAWSLPCGFNHLLPWYYMIYFIILLVHRDSRDMSECRRKYGSAWEEYCRTVRYRLIPRVY